MSLIRTEDRDEDLVARVRDGDSTAFDLLVRRHLKAAYAVALAQLGEPADAEDVVQEAFLTALTRIEECRDPARFRGWLLTIARNRAHNARRDRARRSGVSLERAGEVRSREDPLRDTARGQLRRELTAALDVLTPTEREVVLLYDFEGLRHQEIADQLGISAGSARVHLSNARAKLRKRLGEAHLGEQGP